MDRRNIGRVLGWVALGVMLLVAGLPGIGIAGTTGKLSGRVLDQKKQPLPGVTVRVVGMPLGGVTGEDGRYTIINIPSGKIEVKAGLIGYGPVAVQNVEIAADNTTRLDIDMRESAVQMQETVVSARRAVIEVNRTSNIATVSREQLQAMPVQELQDVVNLQAGVVDGHFRGGREGEVQYQVDGVSVNYAYDNKSTLRLDRSLLEEVQVISGTFDAEYGQAMSGVVNAVLKRGSEKFRWDAEVFTGGPVFGDKTKRLMETKLRPFSQQNYQVSIQGPTLLPKTTYLLSARHYVNEDWVRGVRLFTPFDQHDQEHFILYPRGDNKSVALGHTSEYSGILKVANRTLPNVEVSYQVILNTIEGRNPNRGQWSWRLNPDGLSKQRTLSVTQGMDLTHTLSPTRFYTLSARQNYFDYRDMVYDDVWDPRYEQAGVPLSVPIGPNESIIVSGVSATRFKQNTNGVILKGSFVDQITKEHQLKVGAEFQAPHIQFGAPGYLAYFPDSNNVVKLQRITEYSAKYPGVMERRPFLGAAFAQEEVEWGDLTFRGGVRFEYFDARATIPSDLSNPANSIEGVPLSHPVDVKPKYSLAPRLGVSYPISKNASLFFAYGHFYQLPGLGQIFKDSDYNRLADLQATDLSVPLMGNPDINPERTVQYQFGYKHAVNDYIGVDVTTFFKDVRDLLGAEIIETYNGGQYGRLSNVDFGNVVGFTVTVTQRAKGMFGSKIDYTWQSAQGNSSDPAETANRAAAGEDARPRSIPFNWDQRHTLNLSLTWSRAEKFNVSSIMRISSGQPFTPALTSGFSGGLETNSGRKPNTFTMDLRGDRGLRLFGNETRAFARVFNVFDTRFDNGFVFATTGDPYYSRFPTTDVGTLNDPTRFFGPRRIEVGLTLNVSN